MTPPPLVTRDTLARLLGEHRPLTPRQLPPLLVSGCTCGWGSEVYAHTAHQADALAPLFRDPATLADDEQVVERAAEAFDEWMFRMHGVTSSCDHKTEARGILAAALSEDPT